MTEQGKTFRMAKDAKTTDIEVKNPNFKTEVTEFINSSLPIHGEEEYFVFLDGITEIIAKHSKELTISTPRFDEEMRILDDDELNIVVPNWGGVAPQIVDKPNRIREKYLIIKQATSHSGVLGKPEKHIKKDEHLIVQEGYVLLVGTDSAAWDKGFATIAFAGPGDTCTLHPGDIHGIIAITNALILEKANNTLKSDILSAWD